MPHAYGVKAGADSGSKFCPCGTSFVWILNPTLKRGANMPHAYGVVAGADSGSKSCPYGTSFVWILNPTLKRGANMPHAYGVVAARTRSVKLLQKASRRR